MSLTKNIKEIDDRLRLMYETLAAIYAHGGLNKGHSEALMGEMKEILKIKEELAR